MDKPSLCFDLDGPLLDVRSRYHGVYSGIAGEWGVEPLPRDRYWAAKRARAPLTNFFPGVQDPHELRAFYLGRWLSRIEAAEWLAHDTVVPGAPQCLRELHETHTLYLVTLRREATALSAQLEDTGLRGYFTAVRSGWVKSEPSPGAVSDAAPNREASPGARLKASWMLELVNGSSGALVGDSEIDMEAARLAGIRAIGVSFGIREPADLRAWGAEAVLENIRELPALLEKGAAVSNQRSGSALTSLTGDR